MGNIIGIDLGEKNVGVAVSDETETIATGLDRIRPANLDELISNIKDIITRYDAQELVVGLPLNMNGSKGKAAETVIDFVDKLKDSLSIKISTFDERLTTKQGEAILISANMSIWRLRWI